MRKPFAIAAGAFALVLAAFLALAAVPFVTKKRDQPASITSPPALENVALVVVPPHKSACFRGLAMDARARQARFKAGTYGKPGPPLSVAILPSAVQAQAIAGGWADNSTLTVPVAAPGRDRMASACIANRGSVKIALYAAADRARSRAVANVGAKRTGASPQFGFWEGRPVSIADRAPVTVRRIATFRGPFDHAWIVWLALVLFLAGVPIACAVLVRGAFSAAEPDA